MRNATTVASAHRFGNCGQWGGTREFTGISLLTFVFEIQLANDSTSGGTSGL